MKAAQYSEFGPANVIKIVDIDTPQTKEGQVLVEVHATAINPFDYKVRSGAHGDMGLSLPVTIGADFSGVIVQAGGDFKEGDEVFGSAQVLGGASGATAEFATANIANIALKPHNISFHESAGLVLVGVSAIQVLDKLQLAEGKKILIHGGAGGIGTAAIQYAKSLDAYVATTARSKDADFLKGLGADEVIDFETQRFEDILHDFDAVFDTVGSDTYHRSFQVLQQGGTIISMVEDPDETAAETHHVTALHQATKVNTESLDKLRQLIEEGIIKPQVDRVFTLDQAAAAYEYAETGHPRGKVIIAIKS